MTPLSTVRDWLQSTADVEGKHAKDLLEQFYSSLRVSYLAARQHTNGASPNSEVDAKVKDLFDKIPHSWCIAYEIEQLLSLIMPEAQLNAELQRRLAEAKELKLRYVDRLESIADQNKEDIELKRATFQRLLNDLQWSYSQKIQRSAASRKLGSRVSSMFFGAFIVFFLVISIQFFAQPRALVGAGDSTTANNPQVSERR